MRSLRRHEMAHRDALYNAELNFYAVYNKVPTEADPDGNLLPVDWELTTQRIP
jgi:hypothetical protein